MAKAQSKKKQAGRRGGRRRKQPRRLKRQAVLATKRRGKVVVELKPKEPRTVQRTVRVPTEIDQALEGEIARHHGKLSVPGAIVQILEEWYRKIKASQPA